MMTSSFAPWSNMPQLCLSGKHLVFTALKARKRKSVWKKA